jgi:hypothetical protein
MSSIAPIYPMEVIDYHDKRALKTARAFLIERGGVLVGHGSDKDAGFPSAAGVLATIFARQGDGETAWPLIDGTRSAICEFGGMSEVIRDGKWNMQYLGTALHNLFLQPRGDEVLLFPALPSAWAEAAYQDLLAAGMGISAVFYRTVGVEGTVRNLSPQSLNRHLCWREQLITVTLKPGQEQGFRFTP